MHNWTKRDIDGASKGNPGIASCGGIFINHDVDLMFCFAEPLWSSSSYQAQLCGLMGVIEVSHQMNWKNL
jgi:ribonuclease HI